jgi:acyl-CoA hydrolase
VYKRQAPLLHYDPGEPAPALVKVAERIARFIGDGATLQFGLGDVQTALLRALAGKRHLKIHSGMISDGALGAIDAGVIADAPGAITAGVALGSTALYARCASGPRFRFSPVSYTHAQTTLAGIDRLIAVNSAIEVDLFGQANAEYLGSQQISGAGGLVDFLRGAAASPGGAPILALASTARGGAVSRIVPRIAAPSVSVGRADAGIVVTEHGAADLRGLTIDERAAALIEIAHPDFRRSLAEAWASARARL